VALDPEDYVCALSRTTVAFHGLMNMLNASEMLNPESYAMLRRILLNVHELDLFLRGFVQAGKLYDISPSISRLCLTRTMEVVGIDAAADKDEVLAAIRAAMPGDDDDSAVKAARADVFVTGMCAVRSGQQMATVGVPACEAKSVERVRIGWVSCRVRDRRAEPDRCFRCHGYGHTTRACKVPDLTTACQVL